MKSLPAWGQVLTLLVTGLIAVEPNAQTIESYSLARAPQRSEIATIRDWQPFADYLTRELGYGFELQTFPSRADFEGSLVRGEPDFIFFSPYYHMIAHDRHGYIPLIRSSKELKGILVVKRDSPYQSVRELDGKTFVFPSPNAFAASLYMRVLLTEREKIRTRPAYVETHDNVYRSVLVGRAVAGGGVKRTLSREPPELRDQLRIIYETPGSASHPLSVHPRVPKAARDAVIEAILKLQTTEEGRRMLQKIKIVKPVRADQTRDYGALGRLGLDKYGTLRPEG